MVHPTLRLVAAISLLSCSLSFAQDTDSDATQPKAAAPTNVADLRVPEGSSEELMSFIRNAQKVQPNSLNDYLQLNRIVKQAADKVMAQEKDKTAKTYRDAQQYSLHTGLALLSTLDEKAAKAEYQRYRDYLSAITQWNNNDAQLAAQLPDACERVNRKLAIQAYDEVGKLLAKSGHPQLVKLGASFKGSLQRLELVGKELNLTGTKFDGTKFDLEKLRGKIVLIDFWATWCVPCIQEHDNIRKNYAKYHDKGFEVVGISIDESREALGSFLEEHKVPWITVHEKGGQHPALETYNIKGVPTMFLVDKDGTVISLEARGDALTQLLDEKLGNAAGKEG